MNFRGEIELEQVLQHGLHSFNLVDVRSPSEFSEDTLPGSINIPILDDASRKIIGTIYKQEGPAAAKLKGVELVAPILPDFIKKIHQLNSNGKYTILFCWRGGLRSEFSITFARMAGVNVSKLKLGYKSFRREVMDYFSNYEISDHKFITLYGQTGSGKTELLENLNNDNIAVLNLEKLADHKGSSFGNIDEPGFASITQKKFESRLWNNLLHTSSSIIFTEGESKRIGKVNIPKYLFNKITSGVSVVIDIPLDYRVEYTIATYKPEQFANEIKESLSRIKKYVGNQQTETLYKYLENKDFKSFTAILLKDYYDPLYKKSFPATPDYYLECGNIESAESRLREIYETENNH